MKRNLLILFVLLSILISSVTAQYHWQYPHPQGNRINDMVLLDGTNTLYAVGNSGSMIKSTNRGLEWMMLDSATTANLNSIAFTSQGAGYTVGDYGEILSSNGSDNWTSMESGTHYHINSIAFSSEDKGYAVGYQGMILSKQENSWELLDSPTNYTLYCIDFATINTAIAAGDSGTILRTTDGGTSWDKLNVSYDEAFHDVYFTSESLGFLVGQKGLILRTKDGGETWTDVSYAQLEENLMSVHFINDTAGYTCGAKGSLLQTFNTGDSWTYYNKKTSLSFNEVIQLDPLIDHDTIVYCDTILLAGDNGIVLRSDSCTTRLRNVTSASYHTISALRFATPNMGYAVGGDPFTDEPIFLKTYEGEYWNEIINDTVEHYMTGMHFANPERAYISASNGVVYKVHVDIIDSIIPLDTDVPDHLYSVWAFDTSNVYAAGINGTIIRTIIGDTTWQKLLHSYTSHLYDLYFLNEDLGYAVGDDGIMLRIKNGNQVSKVNTGHSVPFYDITFVTENKGFIVGYKGRIIRINRTNGSISSFTQIPSGVTTPLNEIYFPTPSVGYIAGEGGVILKSTDGGESWLPQYTSTQNGLRTLYFKNEAEGWIAGAGVSILKTENGGGEVITPGIAENELESYDITLYPNPATHDTWIEFELDEKSQVNLSTWDLAGRRLDLIANETQYAGTVRYHYNTSGLPKGIYLVIIEINQVRQAKKLVILR